MLSQPSFPSCSPYPCHSLTICRPCPSYTSTSSSGYSSLQMDPVTILSIVGVTTTIVTRVGTLIHTLTTLGNKYREAQRSCTQLAHRLGLFKENLHELKRYIRQDTHLSRRAESTLRLSLSACEEVLADVERCVAGFNRAQGNRLGVFGKAKHVWNEGEIVECERKLGLHLQMLISYIQLVQLYDF